MIRSMTGYGKADGEGACGRITVEIRSVNHRYGEISVRLPRPLLPFEGEVRKAVAARLKRGKIDVTIQRDETADLQNKPLVNIPLAKAYRDAFDQLREELGLYTDQVNLSLILAQRDVLVGGRPEEADDEGARQELMEAVLRAVDLAEAMRLAEGGALKADLEGRRQALALIMDRLAQRVPVAVENSGARLRERLAQLLGDTAVDEARLAQEIAVMADRSDVTEELVRFNSHLAQFDQMLAQDEPVGRKLDFLLQELNREVNTIGSKANDAEVATLVIELKAELEKIREQVQNIE
jgi:uncharacterized protein (TIGR00255 family)